MVQVSIFAVNWPGTVVTDVCSLSLLYVGVCFLGPEIVMHI